MLLLAFLDVETNPIRAVSIILVLLLTKADVPASPLCATGPEGVTPMIPVSKLAMACAKALELVSLVPASHSNRTGY